MFCIISYLITAFCYYLVFFKTRKEYYEKVNEDYYYSGRVWVDKGKAKFPLWMWFAMGLIGIIPVLGTLTFIVIIVWFSIGFGNECDRERYKINNKIIEFLNKKY